MIGHHCVSCGIDYRSKENPRTCKTIWQSSRGTRKGTQLQRIKDLGTTTATEEKAEQYNIGSIAKALGINHSGLTENELRSAIQAEIKKDKNRA